VIFEIVPNLSEGRNEATIDAAIDAVQACGARVLHRTSDAVHHRSVLTIAGSGEQVLEAAVALAGVAAERIDLRTHRGVHPRIGALDVLPFVPLAGATMEQAVALAHQAGARIWERWQIPSFFYGEAALRTERRLLAEVRRGQFEGLQERFATPGWAPDVGDIARHPGAGAIAIGAREVLVAFNIELADGDLALAKRIAGTLRERDGGFRTLRALGLPLTAGRVQISLNVTCYAATPLYRILEVVRTLAAERGARVANSELIGCLPLEAATAAASYYLGIGP
jgi:glutamate formiminotransferase